jgi:hypothetical protein
MKKKHKTLPRHKNSQKCCRGREQQSRFVPRTGTNDPPPTRCARTHMETHRSRFVLEPGPALVPVRESGPMARTNRDEKGIFH